AARRPSGARPRSPPSRALRAGRRRGARWRTRARRTCASGRAPGAASGSRPRSRGTRQGGRRRAPRRRRSPPAAGARRAREARWRSHGHRSQRPLRPSRRDAGSAAVRARVPVARGDLRRLPLALDGRRNRLEDLAEPLQAHALARLLEQLQLQLGGELESRGERERRLDDVLRRHLDLRAGELDELREEPDASCHVGGIRHVVVVGQRFDRAGVEAPSVGQLEEPEPLAPLDDDVQPAILEALDDLDDARQRSRPAQAVVVRVDETERLPALEALGDELAVARLEDVERDLLRGQQDDPEREQPDLHRPSLRLRAGRGWSFSWRTRIAMAASKPRMAISRMTPTKGAPWGSLSGASGMCQDSTTNSAVSQTKPRDVRSRVNPCRTAARSSASGGWTNARNLLRISAKSAFWIRANDLLAHVPRG